MKIANAYEDSGVQTGSTIMQAEYDGQGRRIVKAVQNSGDLDCTYNYYYRGQSAIEIRNGSDQVLKQNVWGLTYIDELIEVGLNDDPADGLEDDVESFYYAMQDANFNVMGIVDSSGTLTERYEYTPYGKRTVYITPGSNDPDCYAPTTRSTRWTVSSVDQPYGLNSIGHQGLLHDDESGLVYNRARMLTNDRFLQRDPRMDSDKPRAGDGYHDGMGLYELVKSNPMRHTDSTGLCTCGVILVNWPAGKPRACQAGDPPLPFAQVASCIAVTKVENAVCTAAITCNPKWWIPSWKVNMALGIAGGLANLSCCNNKNCSVVTTYICRLNMVGQWVYRYSNTVTMQACP